MRLQNLCLKSFRSYEDLSIDFPASGMVLLKGQSGTGKSTIPLAIAYALGYCPYSATALQSWLTEEPMSVKLTVGDAVIRRGHKPFFQSNGKTITAASKIDDGIEALVGLPPELLAALTYRGQKKPGLFLSKTDAEKKDFLSQILGLDKFEKAIEVATDKLKEVEGRLGHSTLVLETEKTKLFSLTPEEEPVMPTGIASAIETGTGRLKPLEKALADAVAKKEALQSARTKEQEAHGVAHAEDARRLSEVRSEVFSPSPSQELDTLQKTLGVAEARAKVAMAEFDEKRRLAAERVAGLRFSISECERKTQESRRVAAAISELEAKIKTLSGNKCNTCLQPWAHSQDEKVKTEKKVAELRKELATYSNVEFEIDELRAALKDSPQVDVNPNIQKLIELQNKLHGDIRELLAVQRAKFDSDKASRVREIERNSTFVYSEEGQIGRLYEEINNLQREVGGLRSALAQSALQQERLNTQYQLAKQRVEARAAEIKAQEKKVEEHRASVDSLTSAANAERDFIRMVGREGFLGAIFDEVLGEISEESNKILGRVPNVSHVTIRFDSETLTGKGTVKKSIIPVVSVGGHIAPLTSGLSGGMLTSVELAVDLAVGEVISRRSGINPGWLILDESFEGMGMEDKELCMEILKQYSQNRLIIVVDHASEFKERFDVAFEITMKDGISKLEG